MAQLTRVLIRDGWDYCFRRSPVLCAPLFEALMNVDSLPERIRVTISTTASDEDTDIPGAARVPVVWQNRAMGFMWIDWDGYKSGLYAGADRYLEKLGVSKTKPQDIWVDWEPVK